MSKRKDDREYQYHIIYAIDYRGNNDDVLTFVFEGAIWDAITSVFRFLCCPNGIAQGFTQYEEHAPKWRQKKGYRRIAVEINHPNFDFASLDDMRILVESRLQAEMNCKITYYKDYEEFINQ